MSTRDITFLNRWIANNLPDTAKADVISVDELSYKLLADAKAIGIKREELGPEVDNLCRTSSMPPCTMTPACPNER